MRSGRRVRAGLAGAVVGVLATGLAAVGAGTATAAGATEVTCTIDANRPTAPVSVAQGSSVQLVLVLPVLGTRVSVGAPVTVTGSGTQTLQGTVTSLVGGLAGSLCQAAVAVQSAGPLPPVVLPTVPNPVPSVSVVVPELPALPVPGAGAGPATTAPPAAGSSGGSSGGASAAPGGGPTPAPATTGGGAAARPGMAGSVQGAVLGDLLSPVGTGPATAFDFGRVPLYSYAGTPFAVAGGAGRAPAPSALYGSSVPGFSPELGILGAAGPGDGVDPVSSVQALGGSSAPGTIGVVTLAAVLALSATSAVLVRTWVLRRATALVTAS